MNFIITFVIVLFALRILNAFKPRKRKQIRTITGVVLFVLYPVQMVLLLLVVVTLSYVVKRHLKLKVIRQLERRKTCSN